MQAKISKTKISKAKTLKAKSPQTTTKYPTAKVIIGYTLLGGLVGSVIFVIIAQIISLFENGSLIPFNGFGEFIFFGSILGTLPAFLTGIILYNIKAYLRSIKDAIECFLIGFFTTMVCIVPLLIFLYWMFAVYIAIDNLRSMMFFAFILTGGLSSLMLAFLLLPQEKQGENNE